MIVPIYKTDEERGSVLEVANKVRDELAGNLIRVKVDDRDQHRPGYKFSEWELKGVPVRLEIGPRDVEAGQVVMVTRTGGDKEQLALAEATSGMAGVLSRIQTELYDDAKSFREANSHEASDFDELSRGPRSRVGLLDGYLVRRRGLREEGHGRDQSNDPRPPDRTGRPRGRLRGVRQAGQGTGHLGSCLLDPAR